MMLVKIDYELNGSSWKCNLVCHSIKDALSYLEGQLKSPFKLLSTEIVSDVHGITFLDTTTKTNIKKRGRRPKE